MMKKICFAATVSLGAFALQATTWTGGGPDDNWTSAANWGGTALAAGSALVFDGNIRMSPVNGFADGTSFASLTFPATAGAFTLSGNGIRVGGEIRNDAPCVQTVTLPLTCVPGSALMSFITSGGDIVLAGPLAFADAATSEKKFNKHGAETLVLAGERTIDAGKARFILQNGTIRFPSGAVCDWKSSDPAYRFSIDVQPGDVNRKLAVVVDEGARVSLPNITVFSAGTASLSGSTFDLTVNGDLALGANDTDFGDQKGKAITLTVGPNGTLYGKWLSLGTRTPMTTVIDGGTFTASSLAFGRLSVTGDRPGANDFRLISGSVTVSNYFGTMSTSAQFVTNRIVFGGGRQGNAVFTTVPFTRAGVTTGNVLLTFDGAEIVTRAAKTGADFFGGTDFNEVKEGGFIFRGNHAADVFTALEHSPSLADGVRDGGIVKRGSDVLTLCAQPTVTGPIRVEGGRLSFHTAPPTTQSSFYMTPGSQLNMSCNRRTDDVLTAPELTLGSAGGANIQIYINLANVNGSPQSDRVHLPAGGFLGNVNFQLYSTQNGVPFGTAGRYTVITYTDTHPQLSDLRCSGLAAGFTATFEHDAAGHRILLNVVETDEAPVVAASAVWKSAAGGSFSDGANWDPAVPATDGTAVFGPSIAADATVTLDTVPALMSLAVSNAVHAYTLAGAGLRLGTTASVTALARLSVLGGHFVAAPLTTVNSTVVERVEGSLLTVSGGLNADRQVWLSGTGDTLFTGTAGTLQGGLRVTGGRAEFRGVGYALSSDTTRRRLALVGDPAVSGRTAEIAVTEGARLTLSGMLLASGNAQVNTTTRMVVDNASVDAADEVTLGNKTGSALEMVVSGGGLFEGRACVNFACNGTAALTVSNGTFRAYALVFGGYGDSRPSSAAMRGGTGRADVWNGGTIEATDTFRWISDINNQPMTLAVHAGGQALLPPTVRSDWSTGTATLLLDGGALVCRRGGYASADDYLQGLDVFALGAAGGTVNTAARDISIRTGLSRAADAATTEGFVKAGVGTLVLAGTPVDAVPVSVAEGTLVTTPGQVAAATVSDFARLVLTNGTSETTALASLALGNGAELVIDAGDAFAVAESLTFGDASLLRLCGTPAAGTYPFVSAASVTGSLDGVRVLCDGLPPGAACALAQEGNEIRLVVTAATETAHWTPDADGAWATAANWSTGTAPSGAAAVAVVDTAFTAPRTVTLPEAGATAGTLAVAASAKTVFEGGPLAVRTLSVARNDVDFTCPLLPGAEPLAVRLSDGVQVTAAGNVGTGALDLLGTGTFAVTATNAAAVTVTEGTALRLLAEGRQTGAVTLVGGSLTGEGADLAVTAPVTLAGAAKVVAGEDSTLTLSGGASGAALFRKSGPGTVVLEGAYAGTVQADEGLLELAALPADGLVFRKGTVRTRAGVTGTLHAVSDLDSGARCANVLWNDGDLALDGPVALDASVLVKRGAGTLTLSGPRVSIPHVFTGANPSEHNGKVAFGPHGETPAGGCLGLTVTEGTVVFDNPDARFALGGLAVGRWTTDEPGAETAAHALFRSGTFTGYIGVGRGNGSVTTAPGPLASSVTVEGGTLDVSGISMGHSAGLAGYRATPVFTMAGGTLTAESSSPLNIAESQGSFCTFRQTGGTAVFKGGDVKVGNYSPGGSALIDLEGGVMQVRNGLTLAADAASTGTLHLAAGGRLECNILRSGNGTAVIRFDGGTLNVAVGPMTNIDSVVETGDAVFEINSTRVTSYLRLRRGATAGGGLVKRGSGDLVFATGESEPEDDYTGAVRLEEGSFTVRTARAPFPRASALVTAEGTRLVLSDGFAAHVVTVGSAVLAGTVAFHSGDVLAVTGNLSFAPTASVTLSEAGSGAPLSTLGSHTLFTYGGAAPDISGLVVANPADGFSYTFTASDGTVSVAVAAGAGVVYDATWVTDGDGLWSETSNWASGMLPMESSVIRFTKALGAPHTVTADAVEAKGLDFGGTNAYTLAGAGTLTLGGTGMGSLQARQGTHRVEKPVVLVGPVEVTGGGNIVLAGGVTGAQQISKLGTGRLTVGDGSEVTADVRAGILDVSGGTSSGHATLTGGRLAADAADGTFAGTVGLAAPMTFVSGHALTLAGDVRGEERLSVTGGRLRLAQANTRTGPTDLAGGVLELVDGGTPGTGAFTYGGGTLASSGAAESAVSSTVTLNTSPVFDTAGPLLLANGMTTASCRTFWKKGADQLTLAGRWINPAGYNGQFKLCDGTLRLAENAELELSVAPGENPDENALRYQFDTAAGASAYRAIILERGSRLSSGGWFLGQNGAYDVTTSGTGRLEIRIADALMESTGAAYGFIFGDTANMAIDIAMCGGVIRSRPNVYNDIGTRSPVTWTLEDGAQVRLGYSAFGRQAVTGSGRRGGGARITVKDGCFDAGQYLSWQSTDDAAMTNVVTVGAGVRNTNAVFQTVPTLRVGNAGRAELVFDGGLLLATGTATNPPATGTARGSLSNYLSGLNAVRVGPGGAGVSCADDIAITHAFTAEPAGDGGIYKLGTGKAALSGSLASLTGRVDVLAGMLAGRFTNTNDLFVAADATMDLVASDVAADRVFGTVSGSGSAVNGALTVAVALSAGDEPGAVGVFHAADLTLAKGVTIALDRDAGGTTNDLFAVTGALTLNGGMIDFGRAEGDVIAVPFSGVLGTYGTINGSLGGWRVVNAGYPSTRRLSANLRAIDGVVTFTVRDGGLVLVFR